MTQRIAACLDCARVRPVQARGLCNTCLSRSYRQKPNIICADCGEFMRNCARGLCHKCWQIHRHAGDLDRFALRPRISTAARLEQIRGAPDECWPWNWRISIRGYGTYVGAQTGHRVTYLAHRLAYEYWVGPIPEGLVLDHICHNRDATCRADSACPHRRCCNPAHLEAVTSGVNTIRGHTPAADNLAKTHCPRGHEYTPENTYRPPSGGRYCRICAAHKCREWKRKKRAERRGAIYVPEELPAVAVPSADEPDDV